jgi:AcrR family transcriptional regulator
MPRTVAAKRRNVREDIYAAALASFEQQGVRRTLMEDVARQAGVSRPAIYYYFPDKDALVLEVIVRKSEPSTPEKSCTLPAFAAPSGEVYEPMARSWTPSPFTSPASRPGPRP